MTLIKNYGMDSGFLGLKMNKDENIYIHPSLRKLISNKNLGQAKESSLKEKSPFHVYRYLKESVYAKYALLLPRQIFYYSTYQRLSPHANQKG